MGRPLGHHAAMLCWGLMPVCRHRGEQQCASLRGLAACDALQTQQAQCAERDARLQGGNGQHGYSSYQAPAKAGGRSPPSEFICPITQVRARAGCPDSACLW